MEASEGHPWIEGPTFDKGILRVSQKSIQSLEGESTTNLDEIGEAPARNSDLGRDDQCKFPSGEDDICKKTAGLAMMGTSILGRNVGMCTNLYGGLQKRHCFWHWSTISMAGVFGHEPVYI